MTTQTVGHGDVTLKVELTQSFDEAVGHGGASWDHVRMYSTDELSARFQEGTPDRMKSEPWF